MGVGARPCLWAELAMWLLRGFPMGRLSPCVLRHHQGQGGPCPGASRVAAASIPPCTISLS